MTHTLVTSRTTYDSDRTERYDGYFHENDLCECGTNIGNGIDFLIYDTGTLTSKKTSGWMVPALSQNGQVHYPDQERATIPYESTRRAAQTLCDID